MLPPLPTPTIGLVVAVLIALMVGGMAFVALEFCLRRSLLRAARTQNHEHRPCRYCYWGDAQLAEETVRFEEGHVVGVRCFVCHSCSLPQWSVTRTALAPLASQ